MISFYSVTNANRSLLILNTQTAFTVLLSFVVTDRAETANLGINIIKFAKLSLSLSSPPTTCFLAGVVFLLFPLLNSYLKINRKKRLTYGVREMIMTLDGIEWVNRWIDRWWMDGWKSEWTLLVHCILTDLLSARIVRRKIEKKWM
jgi:hypothetical protein